MSLITLPRDVCIYMSRFIESEVDLVRLSSTCRDLRPLLLPFFTTTAARIQTILSRCFHKELYFEKQFLELCGKSPHKNFRFLVVCDAEKEAAIRAAVTPVLPQTVVIGMIEVPPAPATAAGPPPPPDYRLPQLGIANSIVQAMDRIGSLSSHFDNTLWLQRQAILHAVHQPVITPIQLRLPTLQNDRLEELLRAITSPPDVYFGNTPPPE